MQRVKEDSGYGTVSSGTTNISKSSTRDWGNRQGNDTSRKGYVRRSRGVLVQSFGFCDPVRTRRVNTTHDKEGYFENLTILVWTVRRVDLAEKLSRDLYIIRSPEFLERVKGVQRLGFRIFKLTLAIPKSSLLMRGVG